MKYLRWIGLMSSLLTVGALGELMAPLPSEALTVKIDNVTVSLSISSAQQPSGPCSSGYNLCSFITPGRYGNWTVGNVSTTNKARIMIGDNSAANSLDLLKMTGITFTPVVTTGTKTTTVVVTHTYNAGGGNPQGNYSWGYGMAGYFDPPSTPTPENIVGNRLRQIGSGSFAGAIVPQLGSGVDTGVLATPSANNLNGSVTRTSAATVVRANCNTGSARCAPAITQTFTITVVGADKLVLSDSMIAAGGTCRSVDELIPIPPHLYAQMLKLDPQAPNDINQLSAWLGLMGEKYLKKPIQKKLLAYLIRELDKWLAKTVPGTCPEILEEINAVVEDDVEKELEAVAAAGPFEPAEPAPPEETTGTITINKVIPSCVEVACSPQTFHFTLQCLDAPCTNPVDGAVTTNVDGFGSASSTVPAGTYNITETRLSGWSLTSSNCGGTELPAPTTGVVVPAGGTVTCTFNNSPVSTGTGRIAISKQLNIFCEGPCPAETFNFHIFGPTNTTASITTDGAGHGSTSVPVNPGTYSVSEDEPIPGGFILQESSCGDGIPTTGFVVRSESGPGDIVRCHFTNGFGT